MPRNHEGIALIGDPRNDVHLFTSRMLVLPARRDGAFGLGDILAPIY